MKKLICLLAALCALLLMSALAEGGFAFDPERINEAAKSVVILEQKDEEGNITLRASGFAAIEPGLVITSAGFVQTGEAISVITDGGEALTVSGVLGVNTDSDIAIIALEDKEKLALLALGSDKPLLRGSDCVAVGVQGENLSVSIGNISNIYKEDDLSLIQFTSPLSIGSSGSPLFDENGNVAGVIAGYYDDRSGAAQNLNFAVDISEALSLYEIVKEDEIAPLSDWAITDVGLKSFNNPELPMEFYIENQAYTKASAIYLHKSSSPTGFSRISGELKRGETATIRVTQEEYESNDFWRITIMEASWSSKSYTSMPFPISFLLGKTFVFSYYEPGANSSSRILFEEKEKTVVQRRHIPDHVELQTSDAIPPNCIRVVNDTDLSIIEFTSSDMGFSNFMNRNVVYPGRAVFIFISDGYRQSLPTTINLRITFNAHQGKDPVYNWNIQLEDIFGKTMRFYYDENNKVTFEIH